MGYFLPALSGVLLALSFPKADISILAWFGLVPLLYSVRDKKGGRAFLEGLVAGLAFYLGSVYWVINTMFNYGGLGLAVSALLLFALSLYLALYFGAFAWLYAKASSRSGALGLYLAPFFWVTLELLRNYLLSGFPWNLLGYSQHARLSIIQVSDITGVYGVSALVVLINAAVTDIITLRMDSAAGPARRFLVPGAALLLLAAAFAYGHYRLAHMPLQSGSLRVALLQGNIEQAHKWDPAYQEEVFDTYKELTLRAAEKKPGLIIWPETATPFYYEDAEWRLRLEEAVRESGASVMTGSPSYELAADGRYTDYNSAYLLGPDGKAAGRYDKMHLVPFGEYVPLKWLLPFVSRMVTSIGDFGTGKGYTVLDTGKGAFGTAICFEVIFPELVRKFAQNGADFLVSITNDAWFGDSAAPYQHFNMAVFRAVENRRALARAANTGITGIILPTGFVKERTGIFERKSVEADIPLVTEQSFYTRHGDLFAYACAAIGLIGFLLAETGVLHGRT